MISKILKREDFGVLFTLFIFLIISISLLLKGISENEIFSLSYYAKLLISPVKYLKIWFIIPILIPFFWKFGKAIKHSLSHNIPFSQIFIDLKNFWRIFKEAILAYLPLTIILSLSSFVIGRFNIENTDRLKSDLLLSWDQAIFRTTPFLRLSEINFPSWFVDLSAYCFLLLPFIMPIFGIYLFLKNRSLFHEYTSAFVLSLLFMIPVWWFLPALDPRNEYIYNVYNSRETSIYLEAKSYNPQKEILEFQNEIREMQSKSPTGAYPSTTFPSAHCAWALIFAYYCFRANRRLFYIALPISIFSTIATILFAFHYVVDIPAGLLIAIITIYTSNWLRKINCAGEETWSRIKFC